jgi:hypothetical protein
MEVLGWAATLVVLISFTLDGNKLRWMSSLGCSLWMIWGLLKGEPSVWAMNAIIIGIHLWKLRSNIFPIKSIYGNKRKHIS